MLDRGLGLVENGGGVQHFVLNSRALRRPLLRFITNIYAVLLTRGIRGTYVYACDPALRA